MLDPAGEEWNRSTAVAEDEADMGNRASVPPNIRLRIARLVSFGYSISASGTQSIRPVQQSAESG